MNALFAHAGKALTLATLFLSSPFWTSCSGSQPETTEAAPPASPAPTPHPPEPMTWSTPEGWTKVEPSSPQRSFQFERTLADGTQLELVVFAWPSGVGGVNMNLERWRSSVSRGEGDPEPRIETLEGKDMLITLFESRGTVTSMSGEKTPGQVMMRAYIESPAGRFEGVQTVNLTGPAAATEPLLPSIREWLRNQ